MKTIFFGSDDFAQAHLESIIGSGHDVLACVTQPDSAKGRGYKVAVSPIKQYAQEHKIPVLQPVNLDNDNFIEQLKGFAADLFVVVAYGKKIPPLVLEVPKIFAINVHGSILPKYRGAAPINWAIINGEDSTGITIFKISEDFDSGDIIATKETSIKKEDDSVTLRQKMIQQGKNLLRETLDLIETGQYSLSPQDNSKTSKAPKLTKQLGCIDWKRSANDIHNLVRGLLPWPGAYTYYEGKRLKIMSSQVIEKGALNNKPGEIIEIEKEGLRVATLDGILLIKEVHLESSKPMSAHSFVVGHKIEEGFIFGN